MKLWKKIYLITLVIFLVLIHCGIYLVFDMTYKKDIAVEQNRAQSTFQMFGGALKRNMKTLDDQGRLGKEQLATLLETYEHYYRAQQIRLKLWKGEECIYPAEGKTRQTKYFDAEKTRITVVAEQKVKQLYLTDTIEDFADTYYLQCEQPLTELTNTWRVLQKRYILMSLACSVALAVILFLVLQRLMQPIGALSDAVNAMKESQDYTQNHVTVRGKDDIAALGKNFNEMADMIAENLEHTKEEAARKQEFIDNFAHELKSPMTSIYGFAEYVRKANISEEEKEECMDFIMTESDRVLKLSYTLLDLAKLRNVEITKTEVSVEKLYRQVQAQRRDAMAEKQIALTCQADVEQIYGNELLLESLMGNLIGNAIYACENGGKIKLTVRAAQDMYQIVVEDDGCGMTKEEMEHITEPFYRVDKARSRKRGGTGLGLSLCRQIAAVHGGALHFSSEKGKGTQVIASLAMKM